jgi:catechol 2,3-dioxygenase-like lactoylglutathione lyase family enzyme
VANLALGEFNVSGVSGKKVSFSHLAIPVLDVERSIAFYEKYLQMKVVKRRENPTDVWLADGIRPFQLVLLAADKCDIKDARRSGPTDYRNANLAHPIVASAHIGFTCSSSTEVKRLADMAKAEGILEHGPCEEGWPGGYCAYISDPSGHSVEISYNQEAGYNAVFDPVCDLDALKNTYKDGEELWEE